MYWRLYWRPEHFGRLYRGLCVFTTPQGQWVVDTVTVATTAVPSSMRDVIDQGTVFNYT